MNDKPSFYTFLALVYFGLLASVIVSCTKIQERDLGLCETPKGVPIQGTRYANVTLNCNNTILHAVFPVAGFVK